LFATYLLHLLIKKAAFPLPVLKILIISKCHSQRKHCTQPWPTQEEAGEIYNLTAVSDEQDSVDAYQAREIEEVEGAEGASHVGFSKEQVIAGLEIFATIRMIYL
jgi:hypothetical protein